MIKPNAKKISLTNCIGPAFYSVHHDIKENKHTYYDLVGGRGSLKSSFISIEIVKGMMEDPAANAVVYRKVKDTIGDSVYEQICWAIDILGVSNEWHCTVSPYRCIYKPTGQRIIFKGLDKAKKAKSAKVKVGYFKFLWFEELDEFNGPEELRTVQQSMIRGGEKFIVFRSMNPPRSKSNWANSYIAEEKLRPDCLVSETTYLTAPPQWLGKQFILDAEWLKEVNEKAYRHEYLGEPVGIGNNVFDNVVAETITDEQIARFDHIYQGVDWGWYPDIYAFVRCAYDAARETIYIFAEHTCNKQSNRDTAQWIIDHGYNDYKITADSAEPKSVNDYRDMGIPANPAIKGAGSVEYSFKWLISRKIVIDPVRCPKAAEEFIHYEYEKDKDGNVISGFPDKNNHTIDALRYATESFWTRRGNQA